jgi:hypothetical protein
MSMFATTAQDVLPALRAKDLTWQVRGAFLEVAIEMTNPSSEPTVPDDLVIEAAAFGAFVPTVPVARVAVSSMEPNERRRVTAQIPMAVIQQSSALGIDRAIGYPAEFLRLSKIMSSTHWAGNLNVYFDRAPQDAVEAHRAFGLEVPAGQVISLGFAVEPGATYRIDVAASDPDWRVQSEWLTGLFFAIVIVTPPDAVGARSEVEASVTRTSDGRKVPVTFSFVTVAGQGQSLGCVKV